MIEVDKFNVSHSGEACADHVGEQVGAGKTVDEIIASISAATRSKGQRSSCAFGLLAGAFTAMAPKGREECSLSGEACRCRIGRR
jgi:hypothetical protein